MFTKTKCLVFALFFLFFAISFVSAAPTGATVNATNVSSSTLTSTAGNDSAQAGNVSELVIYSLSKTQSWQGYYGNVSGAIQLADSSDYVMYNWSLTSPSGEVYASTNGTIQWANVQCFNFTAMGNYTAETGNGGTTSLYGTNLSQLESRFNLNTTSADGVDETFTLFAGGHDAFFVGSATFADSECRSTRIFDSSGAGVANNFEEVLLYEPASASVIFTSLLENNLNGFNNKTSDFEMLVLEDGHNGDLSSTPYYFFVEIQ